MTFPINKMLVYVFFALPTMLLTGAPHAGILYFSCKVFKEKINERTALF